MTRISKLIASLTTLILSYLMFTAVAFANDISVWHRVVNLPFFEKHMGQGTLTTNSENGSISYLFSHRPSAQESERLFLSTIVIAPVGQLLDKKQHQTDRQNASTQQLIQDFPELGTRARTLPAFFGPGGASFGVVFTSMDDKFDIKIIVSDSGTETGKSSPDPVNLGRELLHIYMRESSL